MARTSKNAGATVLCLIRHGDAETARFPERPVPRADRQGRKQARRAGEGLRRRARPRDAWTSRLVRADQTAKHAMKAAKAAAPVVASATLAPEADPQRILQALAESPPPPAKGADPTARKRKSAAGDAPAVRWVVGHDPHLTRLLGLLVAAQPMGLSLPKGGVAIVECSAAGIEPGAAAS